LLYESVVTTVSDSHYPTNTGFPLSSTLEKYLRVSTAFTERLANCPEDAWTSASPCDGWSAADVAEHVVAVHRQPLTAIGADIESDPSPSLLDRWMKTTERFVHAMSDPELAGRQVAGPMGTVAFKQLAGSIVLHDLLVHTWDFAIATGQLAALDVESAQTALERMQPMSELIRGPGMFGPEVPVADDADVQTRFLCFVGRSPLTQRPVT
jgi:uncharacterized protein (TIGR03086 family)